MEIQNMFVKGKAQHYNDVNSDISNEIFGRGKGESNSKICTEEQVSMSQAVSKTKAKVGSHPPRY